MKTKAFGIFLIVEQLLNRCKRVIENILQAPDLTSVANVSLAIFAQMRHVAREMLQAKVALEAEQCRSRDVTRCCPDASVKYVHTRTVSPETLLGEIRIPVRTFQCRGCGAMFRPDDVALGVPEVGGCHRRRALAVCAGGSGTAASGGQPTLSAMHRDGP